MTDVSFPHPDYIANLPIWVKVDDVCQGQSQLKRKVKPTFLDITSKTHQLKHNNNIRRILNMQFSMV